MRLLLFLLCLKVIHISQMNKNRNRYIRAMMSGGWILLGAYGHGSVTKFLFLFHFFFFFSSRDSLRFTQFTLSGDYLFNENRNI